MSESFQPRRMEQPANPHMSSADAAEKIRNYFKLDGTVPAEEVARKWKDLAETQQKEGFDIDDVVGNEAGLTRNEMQRGAAEIGFDIRTGELITPTTIERGAAVSAELNDEERNALTAFLDTTDRSDAVLKERLDQVIDFSKQKNAGDPLDAMSPEARAGAEKLLGRQN